MDWFPTLASLAGIRIPDRIVMDGRDLSNLLKGRTDEVSFLPQAQALNAEIPLRRYWNPAHEWSQIIERDEYLNAFSTMEVMAHWRLSDRVSGNFIFIRL